MLRAGKSQVALNQDVDEIAARAKSAGITLKAEPHDTDLKSRAFEVTDPSGYLLTVSSEVSSWT